MLITMGEFFAVLLLIIVVIICATVTIGRDIKLKTCRKDKTDEEPPRGRPKLPREDDMDPDDVALLEQWWPEERWPELKTTRAVDDALDWCDLRAIAGDEAEDAQIDEMRGRLSAMVYRHISTQDQWRHAWRALVRHKRRQALLV